MKLYRYQRIPGKVASVKGKVSILFSSSFRLLNVYRYQIVLRLLIDAMPFYLDFVEFQIHADHTQDVGNQNQGYQYISPDLWFTRNSACQNSDWASAKTCQEETCSMFTFYTKFNCLNGSYTALYSIVLHHKHNLN